MTTLSDQTTLVTGANRGLGREFVDQFLARGAAKVYAAARDQRSITMHDPRVIPVALDVTDPTAVTRAAETTSDVAIVVNNAGISSPTPVLSPETTNLRRELEATCSAARGDHCLRRPGRRAIGRGGKPRVRTVVGRARCELQHLEAALWSATDSMHLDLNPRGVQVVGVYMGYVDTDMTAGVDALKTSPGDVVRQVLDGIEAGAAEILADQLARDVRAALNRPVDERYASLTATG